MVTAQCVPVLHVACILVLMSTNVDPTCLVQMSIKVDNEGRVLRCLVYVLAVVKRSIELS